METVNVSEKNNKMIKMRDSPEWQSTKHRWVFNCLHNYKISITVQRIEESKKEEDRLYTRLCSKA